MLRTLPFLLLMVLGSCLSLPVKATDRATEPGPPVAAAASLRQVWPALMTALGNGADPRVSFGASGNLLRQIRQGAPFELFLSADEQYAIALANAGETRDAGVIYALGQLALVAPVASTLGQSLNLETLASRVKNQQLGKVSIANPLHAPYGTAAREVLQATNLWHSVSSNLVLGENAAQALQFALSGAVDAAIVPLSLVTDSIPAGLAMQPVSAALHSPLKHRMVLVKGASNRAAQVYDFLQSSKAQQIFSEYGFSPPHQEIRRKR